MISERFARLKEEMNIKYNHISKVLIQLVEKLNKILPPITLADSVKIITYEWYEGGNVHRYSWIKWYIVDGKIFFLANTLYSGMSDYTIDAKEEIEKLSKDRNYKALHGIAQRLPVFLEEALTYAERENMKLDETLTKLKVILQILK